MDLKKSIALVFSSKFRNFLLLLNANCVTPVFKEVDFCLVMEKGPHKTHCQWFFFLLYLFDYFFLIFCYTCQNFKNVCYTVFSYTRRFLNGMVIHFCYTWLFIKIFVIPMFVIPNFR